MFSADIVDGQVKSVDIGNGEVNSADVKDQSLTTFDVSTFLGADVVDGTLTGADIGDGSIEDEDIAPILLVDFQLNIGVVPASSAWKVPRFFPNIRPTGDHLILTASSSDAAVNLDYTAEYTPAGSGAVDIKVCNPTTNAIDDTTTHFNLLAIDAQ